MDTLDCISLKHAIFLPTYDYILLGICGDNTLRIWGTEIPNVAPVHEEIESDAEADLSCADFRQRFDLIAMRDSYQQRRRGQKLTINLQRSSSTENVIESLKKDYSGGHLTALASSRDGKRLLVATLDSTLVLLATNDGDIAVERVLRLANEVYMTKIDFLLSELPDTNLVICRTNVGDLLLIDLFEEAAGASNTAVNKPLPTTSSSGSATPFLLVEGNCMSFTISSNYKLLAVHQRTGEVDLFSMQFLLRRMEPELNKRNVIRATTAGRKKEPVNSQDLESAQKEVS